MTTPKVQVSVLQGDKLTSGFHGRGTFPEAQMQPLETIIYNCWVPRQGPPQAGLQVDSAAGSPSVGDKAPSPVGIIEPRRAQDFERLPDGSLSTFFCAHTLCG